jgi:hypothetical protein
VITAAVTAALSPVGMEHYFPHADAPIRPGYSGLCACPECYEKMTELELLTTDFRYFINYWLFVDQDTGIVRNLGTGAWLKGGEWQSGTGLWAGQEEFVKVTALHDWIYYLKARQLGETTIECAYDGWAARFRNGAHNNRVHIFSKRELDAQSFLDRVKFGLANLPEHMKIPEGTSNNSVLELVAGPLDTRTIQAYPADNDTARGETCNHAHIDEWAFMGKPNKVWQSIEPSAAGTVHFITTGQGPQNDTSFFWKKVLAGDVTDKKGNKVFASFIGALNRPDRNETWLKAKKLSMADEDAFNKEYPMKWEDALSGGGEYVFKSKEIDAAGKDFRGNMTYVEGTKLGKQPRRYVKAWDIGRHQDAAVGIVLDVTEDVHDVVKYIRLREQPYPFIQREITVVHEEYPGLTLIEDNAAGEAVRENLPFTTQVEGFKTTNASKARILQQVRVALQNWLVKWDPEEHHQLDVEMRGYQLPDDNVVQDSVITLALAEEAAGRMTASTGRLMGVIGT